MDPMNPCPNLQTWTKGQWIWASLIFFGRTVQKSSSPHHLAQFDSKILGFCLKVYPVFRQPQLIYHDLSIISVSFRRFRCFTQFTQFPSSPLHQPAVGLSTPDSAWHTGHSSRRAGSWSEMKDVSYIQVWRVTCDVWRVTCDVCVRGDIYSTCIVYIYIHMQIHIHIHMQIHIHIHIYKFIVYVCEHIERERE
jgi:hypothetical protein